MTLRSHPFGPILGGALLLYLAGVAVVPDVSAVTRPFSSLRIVPRSPAIHTVSPRRWIASSAASVLVAIASAS